MDFAGDLRDVKLPPVKGPAGELEMKISVFFAFERDDAADASGWRTTELVGLEDPNDVRPDGARNHLGIGDAKAIGEVKLFGFEISAQSVGAEILGTVTKAAIGEEQESIGKLDDAAKIIDRFAAERKICAGNARFEASALGVMPTAPDFCVDIR